MRVLIVEDDPLIALELESIVQDQTASETVLCRSAAEAAAALAMPADAALLDIDVLDGKSFGVAELLLARGVPFMFVSGSGASEIPPALKTAPLVMKPYDLSHLESMLAALLDRRPH